MQPSDVAIKHPQASMQAPLRYIEQRGLSLQCCLQGTDITIEALQDSELRIPLGQVHRFYRNLVALSEDPCLGLDIGSQYHLPDYGMWGFALMSAKTLRQAIELGVRLVGLTFTAYRHQIIDQGQGVAHRMTPLTDYGAESRVMQDREMAAVYLIYSELLHTSSPPLLGVTMTHDGGRERERYARHFGCPIEYSAPHIQMVWAKDCFDQVISDSTPDAASYCVRQCEMLVARLSQQTSLVDTVRHRIVEKPGEFPGIEQVAERMNVSSRTLRRRLAEQKASYQDLLSEIRFSLAKEYLLDTNFRLDQIAQLLGYNEQANFTHAFRRWAGVSPRSYRMQHNKK